MVSLSYLALLLTIFLWWWQHRRKQSGRHPPGPPGLPFIGNLHQLHSHNLHITLSNLSKTHGPLMYLKLIKIPVIVISSAKTAKEALQHNDVAFSGRPCSIASKKLSYNGLDIVCSPYTPYWREMRKLIVHHLFTLSRVQSFGPLRQDEVSRMVNEVSERAHAGRAINVSEIIGCFTGRLICRVAFGMKEDEDGESGRLGELLQDVQKMIMEVFVGDHFAFLGWIDEVSGKNCRLEKVFKDMDSYYQQLIDEHVCLNRPKSMDGDVIDLLIQLMKEEQGKSSPRISWDNIKAILMNIFAAGRETSAISLTWAMTALMKNPNAMNKAQNEIRSLVGSKGRVEEEDIHNLPYLKAVLKETLRLYPPLPLSLPRETTKNCTVNGYKIEPKTFLYVNLWAIGRDPEFWENPNEFSPDRFLSSPIDFRGQDFGLIPFGSGRRGCPGYSLAVVALELALANLLYSFDWKLPGGMREDDMDMETLPGSVTLRMKNDLCLLAKSFM